MGKRELLLVICFVVIGVVVHQVTTTPAQSDSSGRSISRFIDHVRREIRGNPATAEATRTAAFAIPPEVTELRVSRHIRHVLITGEDRQGVATELKVSSRGFDDEEAKGTLERTSLQTDTAGTTLELHVDYPREGRQTAWLTVRVPARLRVRIDSRPDTLTIADVAAVEAGNTGGETTITRTAGPVVVTHQGGAITIDEAATVRFTGRNSRLTLRGVHGDATIEQHGGALSASGLDGPIGIESRNAEIRLDGLQSARGAVKVTATGGSVELRRLASEARIEGRDAEIDVTMSAPATVAIQSQGEDVSVTPPPGGFTFDAVSTGGRIAPEATIAALGLTYSASAGEDAAEQRASGDVGGGGPSITVRATNGDVFLRSPEK